ncbi:MAG: GNAT family N-acetyltransferase [Bacteroidota bacterium]
MRIDNLENVTIADLAASFNTAFAGYFVPINFSVEGMEERIRRARIDLQQSVGVFEGEKLVAFMLTGVGEEGHKKLAYNAGTGVIPAFRGQRLVQRMYDWAEPKWRAAGFTDLTLEVIVENDKAIKAYQRVGFTVDRRLVAYEYNSETAAVSSELLTEVRELNWSAYAEIQPFAFSWDYGRAGILAIAEDYRFYEWQEGGTIQAYAVVHKGRRIGQAGCRQNDLEHWTQLLSALQKQHPELSWINIDSRASTVIKALQENEWEPIIEQFEMFRSL